jgi:FkbM family methyltransferase
MNTLSKLILVIKTIVNFPTAILDRLKLLKGNVIYKIRSEDLQFIARAGTEDIAEIAVVASGSEYDIKLISLPKNPTIIDLGGHIGTFSIYIARILKDKCRIYTYEPDTDNYSLLVKNIALNKIKTIFPKNMAISDYVGKGYLKKENMNNDAYHLDNSNKKIANCSVSTLTTIASSNKIKKVDLLKMDIEGGEYKIFQDKKSFDFIKNNVHYIFMEYHNIDKARNYSKIKKLIEINFNILQERTNVLTLENLRWKYN